MNNDNSLDNLYINNGSSFNDLSPNDQDTGAGVHFAPNSYTYSPIYQSPKIVPHNSPSMPLISTNIPFISTSTLTNIPLISSSSSTHKDKQSSVKLDDSSPFNFEGLPEKTIPNDPQIQQGHSACDCYQRDNNNNFGNNNQRKENFQYNNNNQTNNNNYQPSKNNSQSQSSSNKQKPQSIYYTLSAEELQNFVQNSAYNYNNNQLSILKDNNSNFINNQNQFKSAPSLISTNKQPKLKEAMNIVYCNANVNKTLFYLILDTGSLTRIINNIPLQLSDITIPIDVEVNNAQDYAIIARVSWLNKLQYNNGESISLKILFESNDSNNQTLVVETHKYRNSNEKPILKINNTQVKYQNESFDNYNFHSEQASDS
ncbi:10237_t:CDS:2 [Racocetra persica]|uniref:10237_t:CDS:1 n=1 Tax=Racocetra persica TaxID=160502 RepID=A0ACA9NPT3_9GLOM|nr:10237_t:CDS:2 [Racocetra persica]